MGEPTLRGWVFPHMCRDEHVEIGHSTSGEDERCPLCHMRDTALFLFNLLDDIDTASDRAKGDDAAFRSIVERIQRRRFEIASTDGYSVTFHAARPATQKGESVG